MIYMPRPKTTRRPKVYRRKRRLVKRTYKRKTIAKLALRLFETKKHEYRESETNINTLSGWYASAENMKISQGATYAGLDGHFVRGKGISYRGWFRNNATTTVIIRFGVIMAKRGSSIDADTRNGVNVLETNSGNVNTTTATSALKLTGRFNQDQYKIVRQFTYKLGATTATDGSDVRMYKMWIPLNGRSLRYDGSGVLPSNDAYYIFAMPVLGNNDESTGENIEHTFTSTFYYVDT